MFFFFHVFHFNVCFIPLRKNKSEKWIKLQHKIYFTISNLQICIDRSDITYIFQQMFYVLKRLYVTKIHSVNSTTLRFGKKWKINILHFAHLSPSLAVQGVRSNRALQMGLWDLLVLVYLVHPERDNVIVSWGCDRNSSLSDATVCITSCEVGINSNSRWFCKCHCCNSEKVKKKDRKQRKWKSQEKKKKVFWLLLWNSDTRLLLQDWNEFKDFSAETIMEDIQGHTFISAQCSLWIAKTTQNIVWIVSKLHSNQLHQWFCKNTWLTLSPLCPAGPGGPMIPGMPWKTHW